MLRTASRRLLGLVLAGVLVGGLVTACGGGARDGLGGVMPTATPTGPATASTAPTGSASTSPASAPVDRAVFYVADAGRTGPRLYRELHPRPATTGVVRDAVEALLAGSPVDPDYRSVWPTGTVLRDVRLDGSTAVVDLSARANQVTVGATLATAGVQQLVYGITAAAPSVQAVRLLIEGRPVDRLWGSVDTSAPVAPGPASTVLGPVWLLTPADGGTLARGADFGGEASVSEATVSWRWMQGDRVVATGFSTATMGAPGRGTWTAKTDVPPGSYQLEAFEVSAQDGSATFVDSKRVTVTG